MKTRWVPIAGAAYLLSYLWPTTAAFAKAMGNTFWFLMLALGASSQLQATQLIFGPYLPLLVVMGCAIFCVSLVMEGAALHQLCVGWVKNVWPAADYQTYRLGAYAHRCMYFLPKPVRALWGVCAPCLVGVAKGALGAYGLLSLLQVPIVSTLGMLVMMLAAISIGGVSLGKEGWRWYKLMTAPRCRYLIDLQGVTQMSPLDRKKRDLDVRLGRMVVFQKEANNSWSVFDQATGYPSCSSTAQNQILGQSNGMTDLSNKLDELVRKSHTELALQQVLHSAYRAYAQSNSTRGRSQRFLSALRLPVKPSVKACSARWQNLVRRSRERLQQHPWVVKMLAAVLPVLAAVVKAFGYAFGPVALLQMLGVAVNIWTWAPVLVGVMTCLFFVSLTMEGRALYERIITILTGQQAEHIKVSRDDWETSQPSSTSPEKTTGEVAGDYEILLFGAKDKNDLDSLPTEDRDSPYRLCLAYVQDKGDEGVKSSGCWCYYDSKTPSKWTPLSENPNLKKALNWQQDAAGARIGIDLPQKTTGYKNQDEKIKQGRQVLAARYKRYLRKPGLPEHVLCGLSITVVALAKGCSAAAGCFGLLGLLMGPAVVLQSVGCLALGLVAGLSVGAVSFAREGRDTYQYWLHGVSPSHDDPKMSLDTPELAEDLAIRVQSDLNPNNVGAFHGQDAKLNDASCTGNPQCEGNNRSVVLTT